MFNGYGSKSMELELVLWRNISIRPYLFVFLLFSPPAWKVYYIKGYRWWSTSNWVDWRCSTLKSRTVWRDSHQSSGQSRTAEIFPVKQFQKSLLFESESHRKNSFSFTFRKYFTSANLLYSKFRRKTDRQNKHWPPNSAFTYRSTRL